MRVLFIAMASLALAPVLSIGCSSNRIQLCGVLPDPEACPVGRGGTCEDVECTALYACIEGEWVLEKICEAQPAGGHGGSSTGTGGEGGCSGVEIDRTGEANACSPPLQNPDCPAVAAELCRPCDTGCVDFFLCKEDGWNAVAFCDEDGHVVLEP